MENNENIFDGRYGCAGASSISPVRCKRCGKILRALFALEGQSKLELFLQNEDLNTLKEVYIIPISIEEVKEGQHTLLKATGLIKCPECFYVNEIKHECAKNVTENMYKNL